MAWLGQQACARPNMARREQPKQAGDGPAARNGWPIRMRGLGTGGTRSAQAGHRAGPSHGGVGRVAQHAWCTFLQKGPHTFLYLSQDLEHYLYESCNLHLAPQKISYLHFYVLTSSRTEHAVGEPSPVADSTWGRRGGGGGLTTGYARLAHIHGCQ